MNLLGFTSLADSRREDSVDWVASAVSSLYSPAGCCALSDLSALVHSSPSVAREETISHPANHNHEVRV